MLMKMENKISLVEKRMVLGFSANYYAGLQDAHGEFVLDGYDLELNSQSYLY